jgi:tripartite-type tricarboxylate transporter receptor subunit TctC
MGRPDPQAQSEGGVGRVRRGALRMRQRIGRLCAVMMALVLSGVAAGGAAPQDYPNRPITLVAPFPAGGGNDTLARIVAGKLTAALGQQVVVDNRPGANGVIGMRALAKAAPDGYTLLFANSSTTSINPALYANVGYDVRKDFAPVGMIAQMGIGIIATPSFPAYSVTELIALARKQPGTLNIGTSPPGSGSHLSAELFKATAAIDVTLVPYKGAAALTNDLLGGHIPVVFSVVPPALGNIQSGKLRLIAVTTPQRMSLFPDVPTAAEAGLAGFEAVLRYGLLAPAGTPAPIVARLNAALRELVGAADVKQRIAQEGGDPLPSSAEDYAAEMVREDARWGPLIRSLNLKVE